MPYSDSTATKAPMFQPYKYNGKELDRMHGLDWYDYGARMYDPVIGRWNAVDPLAEKYYNVSPYTYCGNNPVRFVDPNGMVIGDYITEDGTYLGSDGKDDHKLYVLKMANSTHVDSYGNVKVNGISSKERRRIIKEKDISNPENFVEVDGNRRIRRDVISKIEDDGTGGTSDNNNREYLMTFARNDVEAFVYSRKGLVGNPTTDKTVSVMVGDSPSVVHIHTHPSGTNGDSYWHPAPSYADIENATSISYVISLYDKNVYIYNNTGVLSLMKLKVYQNFEGCP
ncbi:MAG: RHS repeat-associated core domain-containing protein [Prevotella sp.]|nr:RHS repeat-associated core domain-containing protein [Prevotella sp.]